MVYRRSGRVRPWLFPGEDGTMQEVMPVSRIRLDDLDAVADAAADGLGLVWVPKTHPHDAIALYHRLLPIAAENGTRNARYHEAFDIVKAVKRLRSRLGDDATFADELASIRQTYRAKRNFIKLLQTLG